MIKLIIFDLTGVCFSDEEELFLKLFAKKYKINHQELCTLYYNLIKDAELGKVSGASVWQNIFKKYNISGDPMVVMKDMTNMKEAFLDTLELVKKLRKNYMTAYYANYCNECWNILMSRFDLSEYFDFGIASCNARARKPSFRGLAMIMEYCRVRSEETIFVDNNMYNAADALKIDLRTIYVSDRNKLQEMLEAEGIMFEEEKKRRKR
jgi:FMN phosphatase YigB (HAD superfamily)